ncbi:MAG: MFS transporter [Bacteroidales bacterium]|jgi:ACS family hexuronate transporter-like MFS transporter|nr:MFS transporter [Bacteroidales bacterium]MCI2135304.1 MFS transporter [Bacteroidales bacterium]MDY6319928.1 MFS transporter [Bacteroidales bacterium]MDY6384724.1 MFS transporter [Bacteroidales bacterium]
MGNNKMTNFRWVICAMLFLATTVNYLDRQVLSLTWDEFIKPEFHWDEVDYGNITGVFAIVYAFAQLFAGGIVDKLGTKKGYAVAIGVWSLGACLHALCGVLTESYVGASSRLQLVQATGDMAVMISTFSVWMFIVARCVLALGEGGNFPSAIKATAEYFPKKDRAFATSIFNSGSSIGALVAPLTVPVLAAKFGWEMAFLIIGALGFIWMGFWIFLYKKPSENKHVNAEELVYIEQDKEADARFVKVSAEGPVKKMSIWECFKYKQTWAFALARFLTDGVWWFFLFWTPSYLNTQFGIKTSDPLGMALIFTLYLITMLSIFGGKLPTIIMDKTGKDPYASRTRAMLIFAVIPLVVLLAQPLGKISPWLPVLCIGLGCAAHQSWSANLYTVGTDMFPKRASATITGICGMAAGISSFIFQQVAGRLFVYAGETNMQFMGFTGKPAGYFIIFCVCAVAYLVGWGVMKSLAPRYEPISE